MRPTLMLALLAALLLVPATAHAQDDRVEILRDCADDDILQGDYPATKLRDALDNMPAELEEYSKCRDILSRGIAAKTSASTPPGGTDADDGDVGGGGARTGGDGTGGGAAAPDATPTAAAPRRTGRDVGVQVGPSTPQDWQAIDGAIEAGDAAVAVNGRPISPAAAVGRNGMPSSVIVVLALLALAALTGMLRPLRRRVLPRASAA